MNIPEFVAKWKGSTLTERASAQSWFNDLCGVLAQPTPINTNVDGDTYTFERGAKKTGGGDGWADVWMRGHFAWEFKGKHADPKKRTLTNLYNERSSWLRTLHARLDRAVWDAYGWPADEVPGEVGEEVILERLLELNVVRTSELSASVGME